MIRASSPHILQVFAFVEHVLSLIPDGEGEIDKGRLNAIWKNLGNK